ncbi:MAG: metalloprotease PmbA, partial [Rhodocyclaceae bacterium]
SCSVIAGEGYDMQRDDWYSSKRDPLELAAPETIGDYAARRALSRLGARQLKTRKVPVIFEAPLAAGLLGGFVQAVSGGALYRKSSFLLDSLGKQVFPKFVQISERPHIPKALASSPFDDDGVATRDREVVKDGVVQGYFLSTYTARKLGMETTGNAGGSHNLITAAGKHDLTGLLKEMGTGLLVTELLGQGVNYVTGDYSRGAAGYWVEKGEIAYPVHEITIAGNLKDMFQGIVAIGNDVLVRGSKQIGSVLIDRMTVAGN